MQKFEIFLPKSFAYLVCAYYHQLLLILVDDINKTFNILQA